jgi:hypothetical protein
VGVILKTTEPLITVAFGWDMLEPDIEVLLRMTVTLSLYEPAAK